MSLYYPTLFPPHPLVVLKHEQTSESSRELEKAHVIKPTLRVSDTIGRGQDLGICTCTRCPGNADAAVLGTMLQGHGPTLQDVTHPHPGLALRILDKLLPSIVFPFYISDVTHTHRPITCDSRSQVSL